MFSSIHQNFWFVSQSYQIDYTRESSNSLSSFNKSSYKLIQNANLCRKMSRAMAQHHEQSSLPGPARSSRWTSPTPMQPPRSAYLHPNKEFRSEKMWQPLCPQGPSGHCVVCLWDIIQSLCCIFPSFSMLIWFMQLFQVMTIIASGK